MCLSLVFWFSDGWIFVSGVVTSLFVLKQIHIYFKIYTCLHIYTLTNTTCRVHNEQMYVYNTCNLYVCMTLSHTFLYYDKTTRLLGLQHTCNSYSYMYHYIIECVCSQTYAQIINKCNWSMKSMHCCKHLRRLQTWGLHILHILYKRNITLELCTSFTHTYIVKHSWIHFVHGYLQCWLKFYIISATAISLCVKSVLTTYKFQKYFVKFKYFLSILYYLHYTY